MILASTRPLPAGACGNRSKAEQNHGDENEWEETLNEQESGQDHPPRKRRAGGSQEDQRQEESPGAQETCSA
jgi:hypothetical protein